MFSNTAKNQFYWPTKLKSYSLGPRSLISRYIFALNFGPLVSIKGNNIGSENGTLGSMLQIILKSNEP